MTWATLPHFVEPRYDGITPSLQDPVTWCLSRSKGFYMALDLKLVDLCMYDYVCI